METGGRLSYTQLAANREASVMRREAFEFFAKRVERYVRLNPESNRIDIARAFGCSEHRIVRALERHGKRP